MLTAAQALSVENAAKDQTEMLQVNVQMKEGGWTFTIVCIFLAQVAWCLWTCLVTNSYVKTKKKEILTRSKTFDAFKKEFQDRCMKSHNDLKRDLEAE